MTFPLLITGEELPLPGIGVFHFTFALLGAHFSGRLGSGVTANPWGPRNCGHGPGSGLFDWSADAAAAMPIKSTTDAARESRAGSFVLCFGFSSNCSILTSLAITQRLSFLNRTTFEHCIINPARCNFAEVFVISPVFAPRDRFVSGFGNVVHGGMEEIYLAIRGGFCKIGRL